MQIKAEVDASAIGSIANTRGRPVDLQAGLRALGWTSGEGPVEISEDIKPFIVEKRKLLGIM